jgi:transcription antitermination factor NusG
MNKQTTFTSSEDFEKSILKVFEQELLTKKYIYFSIEDVDFSKKKKPFENEYEIIEMFFISHRYYLKTSYRIRQETVINTLMKYVPSTLYKGSCIYRKEINIEVIKSVSQYLSFLKKISINDKECFYRGQSNFKWNLLPYIYRESVWIKNEKLMIDQMLQNNPEEFNYETTFDTLSKLQHYNLPTRLIDVTINPLVALYFACIANSLEDGQVYIFLPSDKKIKYIDSDTVSVLSNISKMEIDFGNENIIKKDIGRFIHFIRKEKPFFENRLEDECLNNYVFVKANYNNKRITKQNGAFILVGIGKTKKEPAVVEETLTIDKKITKLLIPFNSKKNIIKELELLSIHSGTLFPEIDNVAEYIKTSFLKKNI